MKSSFSPGTTIVDKTTGSSFIYPKMDINLRVSPRWLIRGIGRDCDESIKLIISCYDSTAFVITDDHVGWMYF